MGPVTLDRLEGVRGADWHVAHQNAYTVARGCAIARLRNSHGRKLQLALCALFTLVLSRRTSVSLPCASKLIAGYGVVGGSTVDLPAAALPHA